MNRFRFFDQNGCFGRQTGTADASIVSSKLLVRVESSCWGLILEATFERFSDENDDLD